MITDKQMYEEALRYAQEQREEIKRLREVTAMMVDFASASLLRR